MRIFLGLEKELHELAADKVDRSGVKRRVLDEIVEGKSVFGRSKRNDEAAAGGRCGKGAEIEARNDGEGTEGTDEKFVKVVAGDVLDNAAATNTKAARLVNEFRAR